jgi:flavin-dependent dehydrogenase
VRKKKIQSIAILGGGPAGSALACHLVQQGRKVVLFDDGAKPPLIVGESLIPSILPMLDRLGVRERVASVGQYKPGVRFHLSEKETITFNFQAVSSCNLPTYAYNVPRPVFDTLIADRAAELGVERIGVRAKLERIGDDRVALSAETLAAAPALGGVQPDLIVDASGRSRNIAHLLEIPARTGPRKDVAYFAHYRGFEEESPRGLVAITRLAVGWSWRIPLQDRLSVGVVLNREEAAKLGETAEERLEAVIARDPVLSAAGKNRERVSKVMTYSNYQLISERGHGPGWVMLGDAYGFVDPMLSPGLMLALHSAEILADNLERPEKYAAKMEEWLEAWQDFITYFYDGRIFAMYHTGDAIEKKYPGRMTALMHTHVERNIACMASGARTLSAYSRGLVRFLSKHGSWMANPADYAIA